MIPTIIIGAGRSGTNILRDTLSASTRAATWPCDEINYAWRYGNRSFPTDELRPEHVKPRTRRYLRHLFDSLAERSEAEFIIEKTCANSLRVEFVAEVFPEARFVHIERDMLDVVTSAMGRWRGDVAASYIGAKARYVPKRDLPYYAVRYARHRLSKLFSEDKTLPTWGPRFDGLDTLIQEMPLHVVCAAQWMACTTLATRQLAKLGERGFQIAHVRYEQLACDPHNVVEHLSEQVFGRADPDAIRFAAKNIRRESVGRGRAILPQEALQDIERFVASNSPGHDGRKKW